MQSMHPAWPLPVRTNATATAVFLRPKHWASSARRLKSSSRLHSLHKKGITRKNFRTRPAPSRTCCRLAAVLVLLRPWWKEMCRLRAILTAWNGNGCKQHMVMTDDWSKLKSRSHNEHAYVVQVMPQASFLDSSAATAFVAFCRIESSSVSFKVEVPRMKWDGLWQEAKVFWRMQGIS